MTQQISEDMHGGGVGRESKRLDRRLLVGAAALVALVLTGVFVVSQARESAPAAEAVGTSFVEAFGAFDAEQAIAHLGRDAHISQVISAVGAPGVEGTLEEFRLLLSLLAASGYEQTLRSCDELGGAPAETRVSCTFDYHMFGSEEIGRGPFHGSSFGLTVREGEIVRAELGLGIAEFSTQMWDPFAVWVSRAYPKDAAVMYADETQSGMGLTEESIDLWKRHTAEYVEVMRR